jgi:hypothetical protein
LSAFSVALCLKQILEQVTLAAENDLEQMGQILIISFLDPNFFPRLGDGNPLLWLGLPINFDLILSFTSCECILALAHFLLQNFLAPYLE